MLIKKMSIKKTPEFLLYLLQLLLLIALTFDIREEQLIDLLADSIQRFPHALQSLSLKLFMRRLILNQDLVLFVLVRRGVLAIDELDDWMILVGSGPVGEVFLTLEAEGLVESLLDVLVYVVEGFVLKICLAFFHILVGGDLVSVVALCSVLDFLLLFGGLVVAQWWTLLVRHAHH